MRIAKPDPLSIRRRKPAGPGPSKGATQPLGRRPGRNDTRETILNAAERTFSACGFTGTSLRQLAEEAAVNQSLIFHYFGSKEGLYRAVFLRRGQQLVHDRLALLTNLEKRDGEPPTVKDLVRAYLTPAFDLKRQGQAGIHFLNLQARLHTEPTELTEDLRAALYDEPMQRYVAALQHAMPEIDARTLYWLMVFSIGAYLYTIADLHRMRVLSGEARDGGHDLDETLAQLIVFITGGLTATPQGGR